MKRILISMGCALWLCSHASAQLGGVVVVAANPAEEALWAANELPKWLEMLDKTQQQVDRAKEMIDVVGHPEKFAARFVDLANPALEALRQAKKLESETAVIDATRQGWSLGAAADPVTGRSLSVDKSYQVFGKAVSRDRERYVRLATEKALRTRLKDAIANKRAVDQKELALQEETLAAMRASETQSQIALGQATITASQQRVDLAAAEVSHALAELQNFVGSTSLEEKKLMEEAVERSAAAVNAAARKMDAVESGLRVPSPQPPESLAKEWKPFAVTF